MKNPISIYTDLEAFGYIEEFYPTTFRNELNLSLQQIIGYSYMKGVPAKTSLDVCLTLVSRHIDKIKLLAAFYLIRTKNTMELRSMQVVEKELFEYKLKLSNNEISNKTLQDKAITNEALRKKIFELKDELFIICQRYKVDPNTEVEAVIVNADGSQAEI